MNLIVLATLFVLVVHSVMADTPSPPHPEKIIYDISKADTLFEDFIKEYGRVYKDKADREEHYKAFIESLKKINELNTNQTSAVYGLNKFADYTKEERQHMFGHFGMNSSKKQS